MVRRHNVLELTRWCHKPNAPVYAGRACGRSADGEEEKKYRRGLPHRWTRRVQVLSSERWVVGGTLEGLSRGWREIVLSLSKPLGSSLVPLHMTRLSFFESISSSTLAPWKPARETERGQGKARVVAEVQELNVARLEKFGRVDRWRVCDKRNCQCKNWKRGIKSQNNTLFSAEKNNKEHLKHFTSNVCVLFCCNCSLHACLCLSCACVNVLFLSAPALLMDCHPGLSRKAASFVGLGINPGIMALMPSWVEAKLFKKYWLPDSLSPLFLSLSPPISVSIILSLLYLIVLFWFSLFFIELCIFFFFPHLWLFTFLCFCVSSSSVKSSHSSAFSVIVFSEHQGLFIHLFRLRNLEI